MKVFIVIVSILVSIELHAQCVSLSSGLVLDIPFSNSEILDLSGNNIGVTNYGATSASDRCGNINSAYSFDGVSNYMSLETSNLTLSNYTYSIWLNPSSNSIIQSPLSIGGATGGDQAIKITNSTIEAVTWNVGPYVLVASASPTFNTGSWYHIVTTRDNNFVKIYVNGSLVNSTSTAGASITYSNNTVLGFVGARVNSDQYFNGSIDDLKIYNRVLCDAEVLELYNISCIVTESRNDSFEGTQFNLYPNPTTDKIVISIPTLSNKNVYVAFQNIMGQFVLLCDKKNTNSNIEFDLSSLPKGIYQCLINIEDEASVVKKVVVK